MNKKPKNAEPVRYSNKFLNIAPLLVLIFLNERDSES